MNTFSKTDIRKKLNQMKQKRSQIFFVIFAYLLCFVSSLSMAGTGNVIDIKNQKVMRIDKKSISEKLDSSLLSESNPPKIIWSMGIHGDQFESHLEQYSLSRFYIQSKILYPLFNYLSFHLSPRFYYATGYVLNRDLTSNSANNLNIQNASAVITINRFFNAEFGALDQSVFLHSLLISDSTFPALRFTLQNENMGLTAETAIASSSSISTQTTENEKTPSFNTVGIFNNITNQWMNLKTNLAIYEYTNLPLSVSTVAVQNGNSGQNTSGIDSEFIYQYKGLLASAALNIPLTQKMSIGSNFAYIVNNEAPKKTNQGFQNLIYADIKTSNDITLTPTFEYFEIQSDAAVAYYNDSSMNTNRAGYRFGLATVVQNKIKISIFAGERSVLIENPTQDNEKMIQLKMETLYVPLF